MNNLDHLNNILNQGLGLNQKKVIKSVKSVFADGSVDIYKGQRPVTAGWKIVDPAGNVIMGHSLDRRSAVKTTAIQVMRFAPKGDKEVRAKWRNESKIEIVEVAS